MIYSFAGFELDDSLFELRRNRESVKVEPRVLELILYLIKHRDRVVTKQELQESVWQVETLSDWALTRCVHEARKALSEPGASAADSYIKTIHGRGYRWVGAVEESTTARTGAGSAPATDAEHPAARRRHALPIALAIAGAIGVSAIAVRRARHPAPAPSDASEEARRWASGSHSYRQLTFGRGIISAARFTPDGKTCVYSASWDGAAPEIFLKSPEGPESQPLDLAGARLLSVSPRGELAILLHPRYFASAHVGTLARRHISGGGPEELVTEVESADWPADETAPAIVRITSEGKTLELPPGRVLYRTRGWIETPRVSPRNDSIAFFDHPLGGAWHVTLVDPDGVRKVLTSGFSEGRGIAWSADGATIWFAAGENADSRALFRVTTEGKPELVYRAPYRLRLHDVSKDGRLLVSSESTRVGMYGIARGDSGARDLSWLDFSRVADLSADGKTVLFDEEGVEGAAKWGVFVRGTDGSPARRIGDGEAMALSPDGLLALVVDRGPPDRLKLLPVDGGAPSTIQTARMSVLGEAAFFPDGGRIVFEGSEDGAAMRLYVQTLDGGSPRPITPPGVTMFAGAKPVSPDGRQVAAVSADGENALYQVDGGSIVPVKGIEPGEVLARWGSDGHSLYAYRRTELPLRIYRLDLESGRRTVWMEIAVPDPAGVDRISPVLLTPDGSICVFSFRRTLSELHLVE